MRRDVLALLGHRGLHQQYQKDERHRQDGAQPEDVEEGERQSSNCQISAKAKTIPHKTGMKVGLGSCLGTGLV